MRVLTLGTAAGAIGLAVAGLPAAAAAQSPATERAVALAADGLGGEEALGALGAFRLRATGRTWVLDEGRRPSDTRAPASTFRVRLDYDLRASGDRLRTDSVRTSFGTDRPVTEVVAGRRGYITGADVAFAPAGEKAMTSDRWAAVTRQQRWLNPHLYVRRALLRPRLAEAAGRRNLRGRAHRVLEIGGDIAPVRLFVDARTGRISRLTTVDHNYNRGDVQTVVEYRGWRGAGDGVRFPRTVTIAQAGQVLHRETRSAMRSNPAIAGSRFAIPGGAGARFDRALAERGARTTAWLMSFAHFGFPKDGPMDTIAPVPVAPGSTLIQGIGNQSMVVEQDEGIVVVEAAVNDERGEALIDYVERTFPGKPIRYVTASHHHTDHSSGMRPFVALGARPVVHGDAVSFFERVFAERDSTLLRDRLDESDARADILAVAATGTVTLPDPLRPITVLAEPTEHATTTILVFVPREGVLFVSGDTYAPGFPPGEGGRSLDEVIRANGLAVNWIVGGHGSVISYADFQTALAAPQAP